MNDKSKKNHILIGACLVLAFVGLLLISPSIAASNHKDTWTQFEMSNDYWRNGSGGARDKTNKTSMYYNQKAMTYAKPGDYCLVRGATAVNKPFSSSEVRFSYVGQAEYIMNRAFEDHGNTSVILQARAPGQYGYTWWSGGAWSPDSV